MATRLTLSQHIEATSKYFEDANTALDALKEAFTQNDRRKVESFTSEVKNHLNDYNKAAEKMRFCELLEAYGVQGAVLEAIKVPHYVGYTLKPVKFEGVQTSFAIEKIDKRINFASLFKYLDADMEPITLAGALAKCIAIRKDAEADDGKISDDRISEINVKYRMRKFADILSITDERTISNGKILQTVQKILDASIGESEFKANNHDVHHILEVFSNYSRKTPDKRDYLDEGKFLDLLYAGVCHRIVTGGIYESQMRENTGKALIVAAACHAEKRAQIAAVASDKKSEEKPKFEKKGGSKGKGKTESKGKGKGKTETATAA